MSYTVYILHSPYLLRYYVGYTGLTLDERLQKHLSNHDGYTAKAKDRKVICSFPISDKKDAMKLEQKIKKRGIKRYLNDIGYTTID